MSVESIGEPRQQVVLWRELAQMWPLLSGRRRRALLRTTAELVHRLWREGADLSRVVLDAMAFKPLEPIPEVKPPYGDLGLGREAEPLERLFDKLASLYVQAGSALSRREALYFLRAFLAQEQLEPGSLWEAARRIDRVAARERRLRAVGLYRQALATGVRLREAGAGAVGYWSPQPALPPGDLAGAIRAAEASPDTEVIRAHPNAAVLRGQLFGRDVLIKRYEKRRVPARLKYAVRVSRSQRAYAAAWTLRRIGIPTPAPLGFLSFRAGGLPSESYYIVECIPQTCTLRRWLEQYYGEQPEEARIALRETLLERLLQLYRHGAYHADTKASNIIMPDRPEGPFARMAWIDLDCVRFGAKPSRYQVLRNLVQLNGSVCAFVGRADRLAFLRRMARDFPWVSGAAVQGWIAVQCAWRLQKERWGWAGP